MEPGSCCCTAIGAGAGGPRPGPSSSSVRCRCSTSTPTRSAQRSVSGCTPAHRRRPWAAAACRPRRRSRSASWRCDAWSCSTPWTIPVPAGWQDAPGMCWKGCIGGRIVTGTGGGTTSTAMRGCGRREDVRQASSAAISSSGFGCGRGGAGGRAPRRRAQLRPARHRGRARQPGHRLQRLDAGTGGPAGPQRRHQMRGLELARREAAYAALWPRAMQGHVPSVAAQQVTLNRRRDSFNARLAERAGLLTCLSSLLVVP